MYIVAIKMRKLPGLEIQFGESISKKKKKARDSFIFTIIWGGYVQLQDINWPASQSESKICQGLKQNYNHFRVRIAPELHGAYTSKYMHGLCVYTKTDTHINVNYILYLK